MQLAGRTVAITGATGGIGARLVSRCVELGARVAATDRDAAEVTALANELGPGHLAAPCDLADTPAFEAFLDHAERRLGAIDVLIANAGVADGTDPISTLDAVWDRALAVNVRAHVVGVRRLLPGWLARGEGYFVSVASAAGLLTQIGSAPYAVSKHAAVAFAEWMAITYGDRGVGVSCVCPMGVDTGMLQPGLDGALDELGSRIVRGAGEVLAPDEVARRILEAVADERFLVLPHPEVAAFFARKGADYERWIAGMRRLQAGTISA